MARRYRFYAGVRQMPLQFNLVGMRVSMTVILLFLADLITAVVLTVIASKLAEGTPFLIAVVTITVIALIIAAVLIWWVARLSRLGPLPVEKQFRLLKETAHQPVWTGIDHIDNNKKEQIR